MILNVEPLDGNPEDKFGWNYLRALDKRTGKTIWVADDATTTYTTSVFGKTKDGRPAVLTKRPRWLARCARATRWAAADRPVGR